VSTSSSQTLPFSLSKAIPTVNFEEVLNTPSYVTNLDDFLNEDDYLKALLYWLEKHEITAQIKTTSSITHAINRSIAEIDELINEQLNVIIHNEKLQKLEASWRGLWYLSVQAEGALNIKIKVLDVSWNEVVKDIARSLEFDQSQLFQKIYSEEYGTPGGEPYGVLIGDYEISHRLSKRHPNDDVATLEGVSQVAAAAFAPFIAGASYELFGLDSFSGLSTPINLRTVFAQQEYLKWNSLREKIDSRFLGLTVPRILMRLPYRTKPGSYKGIFFYEKSATAEHENYLWGNASYGFAAILIREYANVGWFGHIRGVPRNQVAGGLLTNLPVDCFATDADNIAHKPVTDVLITDTREREISDLGLIPLCQCYDTPFAAFYNNQSVQAPKIVDSKDTNINAKLSGMLQHVLCGSRIAHYIKVMIRDKVGSFVTASDCENYLRDWLFKYTTGRDDLEWEEQARYPLKEAAVQVKEHPEKPGSYLCVIHLKPHYQLDQMVSELELVTELAQSGK
jgi:type VI secretion system protein ImpD